jgi:rfaE bifunctional protein nucleotidyltransferase chain/domain
VVDGAAEGIEQWAYMQELERLRAKILDREAIQAWASAQHAAGKQVGFTCGAFDILHAGHVEYLTRARGYCDALMVAVNSDRSIQSYKSALRPINKQEQRLKVVAALEAVDAVTLMEETRPAGLIELLKPDVYIKGGDYAAGNLRSKPLVESYGGRVVTIPIDSDTSTTAILERAALLELHERIAPGARTQEPRLVFLDRDGTLIRDVPFLHDPARVEVMPGVLDGLKALQETGFTLVVITNQQGIGLGYYGETEFFQVNQALFRQLAPAGIKIARVYYCPHSLAEGCDCRKPGKLLLERAVKYFHTKPDLCYMVGDSIGDCEAAASAGCASILISEKSVTDVPCSYRASSFREAADWIVRRSTASQMA